MTHRPAAAVLAAIMNAVTAWKACPCAPWARPSRGRGRPLSTTMGQRSTARRAKTDFGSEAIGPLTQPWTVKMPDMASGRWHGEGRKVQAPPRGGTRGATAGRKVRAGSQAIVQPSQVGIDVARRTTVRCDATARSDDPAPGSTLKARPDLP